MPTPARRPLSCLMLVCLLALLMPTALWAVGPLATIPVGLGPGPMVIDPTTHSVYVVNTGDNTVSVIDSESLMVKAVVKVAAGPSYIAANPAANLVYVASVNGGTITAIQGTKVVGTLKIGGMPIGMVVDTVLNQVYVADQARDQVEIYNASTGKLLSTLAMGMHPSAMALNLATHAVFVACYLGSSGSEVVIDGTHNQIATTVGNLPGGMTSISVDPITNVSVSTSPSTNTVTVVYAANGYSVLEEAGNGDQDAIASVYDAGNPGLFVIDDTGDGDIWFALGQGLFTLGDFYHVDLTHASALTVNPATNQIGITYPTGNPAGDVVYIIDLLTPGFLSDYHHLISGLGPTEILFDPLTNRAFVTNNYDGTVSVFDVTPGETVPAYEANFEGFNLGYNYIDVNPATGITYTLRLGDLFAINEAQAGAGANGLGGDTAGVTTIPLSSDYSEALTVDSASNKVYVADGASLFYSVDGTSNVATLLTTLPPNANIRSLATDYAANEIIAWDYFSNDVFVLDGTTGALLKTVATTSSGASLVFVDSAKNLVYAASNPVSVIDPAAGSVVATIPLTGSMLGAALNPADSRLYVVETGSLLYVIDTSKNSVVTSVTLPNYTFESMSVNPITGNYYLGMDSAGTGHVVIYSGTSNALLSDLSGADITDAVDIKANPLTDTMYVGSDRGTSTAVVAVIDGLTNAVSGLPPSGYDSAAHALAVDLSTGLLAGAGQSYTTLWFPSSDFTGETEVPIAMAAQGVKDSMTIATTPLFRTHNTTPSFLIAATSNFSAQAAALVPKQAFYQVDGWQGPWTAVTLTAENSTTSYAKVKLPKLATGRHILYAYSSSGDIATVQASTTGVNTPVISPMGSVVFTVEK
jgi:YVTN family beta-propeller protein